MGGKVSKEKRQEYYQKNKDRIKTKTKARYNEKKDQIAAYRKVYNKENSDKAREYRLKYCEQHKEEIKEKKRQYIQKNKKKALSWWAKRYAGKKNRTPGWADLKAIEEFYINCPEGYEVDHIIPLHGKDVSGLHVIDNLQYLTKEENRKKSNKHTSVLGSDTNI